MASEPQINHDDLPAAARDIYREYGGPGIILKTADEIERLRAQVHAFAYAADDAERRDLADQARAELDGLAQTWQT